MPLVLTDSAPSRTDLPCPNRLLSALETLENFANTTGINVTVSFKPAPTAPVPLPLPLP